MTFPCRVLVVDDDFDLRYVLRRALEETGRCRVVAEAADGLEGIKAAQEHQPDLVVLDLHMPVLDGFQALPRIRDAVPDGLIVVLTGVGATGEREKVGDHATAFLAKGMRPSELASALVELYDQGSLGGPAVDRLVVDLPETLTSARMARRAVREALERWEVTALLDEAELLTSELVTNALIHASSAAKMAITRFRRRIRVEVTDSGRGELQLIDADETATHGRGLAIVEALASSWGAHDDGRDRTVWFELHQP